jgi:hypothetical protein
MYTYGLLRQAHSLTKQLPKVILASKCAVARDSVVTMLRIVNDEPPGRDRQEHAFVDSTSFEKSVLACRAGSTGKDLLVTVSDGCNTRETVR